MDKSILNSKIGFGTYLMTNETELFDAIICAIKNKYDFIDTATYYKNEKIIGKAIKYATKNNMTIPFIQTKIWVDKFDKNIVAEIKKSMKKLNLECIDSVLLHRPHTNMEYNVKAWIGLIKAKELGLVNHIGVSNFDRDMIEILFNETGVYPEINQIEHSATYCRMDRINYNKSIEASIQGWRPLGLLSENLENKTLKAIARRHKCSVVDVLISYCKYFNVIPIVKSSNCERIISNKKSLKIKLTKREVELIQLRVNTHEPTTSAKNDTYANLSLSNSWYKTRKTKYKLNNA